MVMNEFQLLNSGVDTIAHENLHLWQIEVHPDNNLNVSGCQSMGKPCYKRSINNPKLLRAAEDKHQQRQANVFLTRSLTRKVESGQ